MKIAMCFMVLLMPMAAQAQCSEGTAPTVIAAGSAIGPVALSDGGMSDDRLAPQRAVLRDVHFQWPREVGASRARRGCPQLDYLSFSVDGDDESTDTAALRIAVFTGPDADAALNPATGAINLERFLNVAYRRVAITLGNAEGHQRDGVGLRTSGAFCFAVALVDANANVGPRSEATCLDTTSSTDPLLEYFDEPIGCSATSGLSMAGLLMCLMLLRFLSRPS